MMKLPSLLPSIAAQKATDAGGAIAAGRHCELYAVGDMVTYVGGRPPLPPEPWVIRDALVERPFNANDVPFLNDKARAVVAKWYGISGLHNKALAVSPRGIRGLLP